MCSIHYTEMGSTLECLATAINEPIKQPASQLTSCEHRTSTSHEMPDWSPPKRNWLCQAVSYQSPQHNYEFSSFYVVTRFRFFKDKFSRRLSFLTWMWRDYLNEFAPKTHSSVLSSMYVVWGVGISSSVFKHYQDRSSMRHDQDLYLREAKMEQRKQTVVTAGFINEKKSCD